VFTSYTAQDGLLEGEVNDVLVAHDGAVWFATDCGLSRLAGGRFTSYEIPDAFPNIPLALAEEPSGTLWVGTTGGVVRLEGGRFTTYTTADGLPDDYVETLV